MFDDKTENINIEGAISYPGPKAVKKTSFLHAKLAC